MDVTSFYGLALHSSDEYSDARICPEPECGASLWVPFGWAASVNNRTLFRILCETSNHHSSPVALTAGQSCKTQLITEYIPNDSYKLAPTW